MFKPVSLLGKVFKRYLLLSEHPAKVRIENIMGRYWFPHGIKIKNSEGVLLKLAANDWITRTMIEQGDYEPNSILLGKEILKSGGVLVDVGANFGLYSCLLGFKNNGLKVFSIEPNHKVLHWLYENVQNNLGNKQVQIINVAVSDKFQFVFLEQVENNNHGTTVTSLICNEGVAVLSCSLEYILESNRITKVDLLKIDIEGNEFSILENFPFDKYVIKNIILEFNFLSKITLTQLLNFFEKKGFTCFKINGEKISNFLGDLIENNIWCVNTKIDKL